MLGARKLTTKESVINKEPTNATTRHPNFCRTGGSNGPENITQILYNIDHGFEIQKNHVCSDLIQE